MPDLKQLLREAAAQGATKEQLDVIYNAYQEKVKKKDQPISQGFGAGLEPSQPYRPSVLMPGVEPVYGEVPKKKEAKFSYNPQSFSQSIKALKEYSKGKTKDIQDFADPRLNELWQLSKQNASQTGSDPVADFATAVLDTASDLVPVRIKNAWNKGAIQGNQAAIIGTAEGQLTPEQISELSSLERQSLQIPQSEEEKKFSEGGFSWLFSNPIQGSKFIGEILASSLSSQLSASKRTIPAGVATGAVAGSVIPGIGTLAGAATGATAGMVTSTLSIETSQKVLEALKEAGFDTTDEESLARGLLNKDLVERAREKGLKRGVPIMIMDAATAGLGSKLLLGSGSKLAKGLGAMGVEAAGGAGGEFLAQVSAGEKIRPTDIALEAIAEIGAGAPSLITETAGRLISRDKTSASNENIAKSIAIDPKNGAQDAVRNLNNQLQEGRITEEEYNEGIAFVEKSEKAKDKVPVDLNDDVKAEAIVLVDKKDDLLNEIAELEKQKETLDDAFHKPIDDQIAEKQTELETINTQIQDAVQKQAAGQVPVQPEAQVGREVAQGEPQAEPQAPAEGVQEEVETDFTGKKSESLQERIDELEESLISFYMSKYGLSEDDAIRKYLFEPLDSIDPDFEFKQEIESSINKRNSLFENTVSELSKVIDEAGAKLGLKEEVVDVFKDSINIGRKGSNVVRSYVESISDRLSEKKINETIKKVIIEDLESQGLDYEGVLGQDSGWSDSKKRSYIKDIRNKVLSLRDAVIKRSVSGDIEVKPKEPKKISVGDKEKIDRSKFRIERDRDIVGQNKWAINIDDEDLYTQYFFEDQRDGLWRTKAEAQESIEDFIKSREEERAQAVASKEVGVSVSNKESLDNLKTKVTDSVKKKVIRSAEKAITTLKSVLPDFDIVLHENEDDYNKSVSAFGGATNTRGNFRISTNPDGTVTGRIDINLNRANARTVAHEVAHGVMYKAFGEDVQLFKDFKNRVSKALSESSNQELANFANMYDEEASYEEYLAELTALLEQQEADLSPGIIQKIAQAINDVVSRITNGKFVPFKDAKVTENVIEFFNTVAGAIREGQEISVDGVSGIINPDAKPNRKVDVFSIKNKATLIQDLGLVRQPNIEDRIQYNVDLKDLGKVVSHLTFSDRLVTGTVGNKEYLGGILFAAATNRVWASFTERRVNAIIKGMVMNSDGYRYLAPALLSEESHMSNKDMVNTSLSLVEQSISKGKISPDDADNKIKKVLNKKNLSRFKDLYESKIGSKRVTKDSVSDAVREAILNSNSTFEQRKEFLESLLTKADKNVTLRFGDLPSFKGLANGLAEPISKDHDFGDILLFIRTKGDLIAVQPKKGDPDYHPSYPWVIRSVNKDGSIADVETLILKKSYNAVDVFPEVTNASGKKVSFEDYKKAYGNIAESKYLNYMGAGPMSTSVSEAIETEAKPKKELEISVKNKSQIDDSLSKASGTTQVATTTGSYAKAAGILKNKGITGRVLDYGAGLGLGTDAMSKVLGKPVESYEINTERWKGSKPATYTKSEDIKPGFDGIVSLNVVNVVPKSIRDFIIKDIFNNLKEGGTAVISSRKFKGDIDGAKNFELGPEDKSYIIKRQKDGQTIDVYQKGFDGDELVDYVKEVLGDRVSVTKDNSFGAAGVVIEKKPVSKAQKAEQEGEEGGLIKRPAGKLARVREGIAKVFRRGEKEVGRAIKPEEFAEFEEVPSDKGKELLLRSLKAPQRAADKIKAAQGSVGNYYNKLRRALTSTKYDIQKALDKVGSVGELARAAMENIKGSTAVSSLFSTKANLEIFKNLSFAPSVKMELMDKGKKVKTVWSERQLFDTFLDAKRIISIDARIRDKFSELIQLSKKLKDGVKNNTLNAEEREALVKKISVIKEYLLRRNALLLKGPEANVQMIGYQDPNFIYTDKEINLLKEDYEPLQYKHTDNKTMADAEAILNEIKSQHPELYKKLDDLAFKYNDAFRDLLKENYDAGLIDKETYDELFSYNYIPTKFIQHFIENELSVDNPSRAKNLSASIKNLTGGSEEDVITNYQAVLDLYAHATYRRIFQNRAAELLSKAISGIDKAKFGNQQFYIQQPSGKNKYGKPKYEAPPRGYDSIVYYENGVEKRIIAPQQFVDIWNDTEFQSAPWLDSTIDFFRKFTLVNFITGVFTKYSPVFGATQILMDAPQALITSKAYPDLFLGSILLASDYAAVAKDVKSSVSGKPTPFFIEAVRAGVFSDFLSTENDLIKGQKFTNYDGSSNIKNRVKYLISRIDRGVDKTLQTIAKFNEATEYSTRLAVYRRMKMNLVSDYKSKTGTEPTGSDLEDIKTLAANEARRIVDFSAAGGIVKPANKLLAYLNSTIQVFVSAARSLKNNPYKAGLMLAEMGLASAALLAYSLGDLGGSEEEKRKRYKEYKKRSKYERESYFLFWTGDPDRPFARLQKPPLFRGFINMFEQGYLNATRGEDFNQGEMWSAFKRDIPFGNPLAELVRNPMINAYYKYSQNYDAFREERIVKDEEKTWDYAEVKGASKLYRNIGKLSKEYGIAGEEGVSPMRMQAAVESFTGDPSKNTFASLLDISGKTLLALKDGDTKVFEERFKGGNPALDLFEASGLQGKLFSKKLDYDASFAEELEKDEKDEYTKNLLINSDLKELRETYETLDEAYGQIREYLSEKVKSKDITPEYASKIGKKQEKLFNLKDENLPEFYDEVFYADNNKKKAKILNHYTSDLKDSEAIKIYQQVIDLDLASAEAAEMAAQLRFSKKGKNEK